MFSASSSLNFGPCPVDPVAGSIRLEDLPDSPIGQTGDHNDDLRISVVVSESSPAIHYRSDAEPLKLNEGQVFLYIPIQLLNVNFDGVIKPAVKISDRSSWGPFYYRWEITPSLKGQVNLSRTNLWPITFRLQAPLEVSGQAGAGVKIGSVRYEAVAMMFEGDVDPFDIEFRVMLDWPRREISFESRIERINAHDFYFTTMPLDFPVNKIVDVILSGAAKTIVNEQAEKILSVTRIPIANLQLLEEVADLDRGLAGYSDSHGNATMGVLYRSPAP